MVMVAQHQAIIIFLSVFFLNLVFLLGKLKVQQNANKCAPAGVR